MARTTTWSNKTELIQLTSSSSSSGQEHGRGSLFDLYLFFNEDTLKKDDTSARTIRHKNSSYYKRWTRTTWQKMRSCFKKWVYFLLCMMAMANIWQFCGTHCQFDVHACLVCDIFPIPGLNKMIWWPGIGYFSSWPARLCLIALSISAFYINSFWKQIHLICGNKNIYI